ncbi:coiled-coil domain-containing protein 81-like isoform X2 [Bolinopsis microptera]|uniref:coiled-coil domain-containing protein 81-like isoform X2 n=1 Tax=Bolinopsis microptera TaxID=2820187 RepID=UPI00307A072D
MSGELNYSLVQEAKKCKYSLIPANLSVEDVLFVWQNVSQFIVRQLLQNKAVNMTGLGMFSVLKRSLDLGSDRRVYVQRPIFVLSEKFAKLHGITYAKYQSPGEVPVVQLNLAAISMEIGVDRDVVDTCIRELISTFSRTVNSRKHSYLAFKDIGQLVVKDGKAKMKFFKDFLRTIDGTRSLMTSHLLSRPHTTDSFISRSSMMSSMSSMRPNTYVLPSASNRNIWTNTKTEDEIPDRPPSVISNHGGNLTLSPLGTVDEDEVPNELEVKFDLPAPPTRSSFCSDVLAYDGGMEIPKLENISKIKKSDLKPVKVKEEEPLPEKEIKTTFKDPLQTVIVSEEEAKKPLSPELAAGCKHNSGQELCYLCHQRQRRNIPISFTEEKAKAEQELDRVLQQYQMFKDDQFYDQERRYVSREKEMCKEVAESNLVLAEKVRQEKVPDKAFHQSYIFARSGTVPRRYLTQDQYSNILDGQVKIKTDRHQKEKSETDKQERAEQTYLTQGLAASKQRFIESKASAIKQYQTALNSQLQNQPFRFPPAVPDSEGPIFGKIDVTPERVRDMRKRAKEVMKHQLKAMEDKKNGVEKEKQNSVKYEVELLERAKTELREECYKKYLMRKGVRDGLEKSWLAQSQLKVSRETDELKHRMKSGLTLLHIWDRIAAARSMRQIQTLRTVQEML